MKLAFAGTPDFAAVALRALHGAGHDVALVLSQPDRPAGRGLRLQASAVKQAALELGLPVAQPRGLRLDGKFADDAAAARELLNVARVDAMVVAAYGLILPRWLLDLPPLGCLNIHGSLLPRWRGAAPVQRAIESGDALTGVTIMQMDEGLDTGAMRLIRSTPIRTDDNATTLMARLAVIGATAIVDALRDLPELPLIAQPAEGVTYAAKIAKDEARIAWSAPAAVIERRVRAFDPFPGATFEHRGETVKLWRARVADAAGLAGNVAPGTVIASDDHRLCVACGEGAIDLIELQWPGGKRQGLPIAAQRRPALLTLLSGAQDAALVPDGATTTSP
jgi:methionyl-tRNA formyltransferase